MKSIIMVLVGVIIGFAQPRHSNDVPKVKPVQKPMLLGLADRNDLLQEPYGEWFNQEYEEYDLDTGVLEPLQEMVSGVEFQIFLGTWCSDSRREVPRVYKILDYLKIPADKSTLIGVDRKRLSPGQEEQGRDIHHVPTIIFYQNKQEIGRIIEYPVESLEEDFVSILLGFPYIPNYQDTE